jgi:hypothetical protein
MILRDNTAIKPTLFKGGSQNPMTSVVRVRQTVIGITMYHVKTPSPKVQGGKGAVLGTPACVGDCPRCTRYTRCTGVHLACSSARVRSYPCALIKTSV